MLCAARHLGFESLTLRQTEVSDCLPLFFFIRFPPDRRRPSATRTNQQHYGTVHCSVGWLTAAQTPTPQDARKDSLSYCNRCGPAMPEYPSWLRHCEAISLRSKSFLKKFFRRFQEGVRLILSRSLAYPQGKILGAAIGTISRSLSSASLSSSAALPLESGCKGTDFFRFRNFYCILFCRIFSVFLPNSLIYFMLYSIFFIVVRKRM